MGGSHGDGKVIYCHLGGKSVTKPSNMLKRLWCSLTYGARALVVVRTAEEDEVVMGSHRSF